jgi:GNAT superfamily N-acetyltransferase
MVNKPRKRTLRREKYGIRMLPSNGAYRPRYIVNGKLVPLRGDRLLMPLPGKTGSKGSLSFYVDEGKHARSVEITGIFVPPHQRGKGYSRLLLQDAIQRAKKLSASKVLASTRDDHAFVRARRLLRSEGFKEIGSDWATVKGQPIYRVIDFEKPLK